jgi:hypothetical protein
VLRAAATENPKLTTELMTVISAQRTNGKVIQDTPTTLERKSLTLRHERVTLGAAPCRLVRIEGAALTVGVEGRCSATARSS